MASDQPEMDECVFAWVMIELETPATLIDAQTGHEDGSVQACYSHTTEGMTGRLAVECDDGARTVGRTAA